MTGVGRLRGTDDDGVGPTARVVADLLVGRADGTPVDWETVLPWVRQENLAPLLDRALTAQPHVAVPVVARKALSDAYATALFRSLYYQSLRRRFCERLQERGIPVLLLKGAALAYTCYEDPATRPMVDLDFLVPEAQVALAARGLEEDGFERISGSLDPTPRSPREHLVYCQREGEAVVELHWQLKALGRARLAALQGIWAETRPLAEGAGARVMRPAHAIPFLCAHAFLQHGEARFLWLYDLYRLCLQLEDEEAAVLQSTARLWGLAPVTARALGRVHELFGVSLPDALWSWTLAESARPTLQGVFTDTVLHLPADRLPSPDLLDLLSGRDRGLLRALFPPPKELRERLGLPSYANLLPAYIGLMARHARNGLPHLGRTVWLLFGGSIPTGSRKKGSGAAR